MATSTSTMSTLAQDTRARVWQPARERRPIRPEKDGKGRRTFLLPEVSNSAQRTAHSAQHRAE